MTPDEIVEYGETQMPRFGGEKAFVLFPGQAALIDAVKRRQPVLCPYRLQPGNLLVELEEGMSFPVTAGSGMDAGT